MKKREKQSSRKRTALRRCAILAAVVVLASAGNLYNFLPIQAVWDMADGNDIEHPRVVRRFYDGTLPVTRFALHYLVEGDHAVMLCVAGYHPLMGWYDRSYAKVETWDGTGLYAEVYGHRQGEAETAYLFGRVDDPAVRHLFLRITENVHGENPSTRTVEIPAADIWERDGARYVLTKLEDVSVGAYSAFEVLGFDEAGLPVTAVEAQQHTWST